MSIATDTLLELADRRLAERPLGQRHSSSWQVALIAHHHGDQAHTLSIIRNPVHDAVIARLGRGYDQPYSELFLKPYPDDVMDLFYPAGAPAEHEEDLDIVEQLLRDGTVTLPNLVPYGYVRDGQIFGILSFQENYQTLDDAPSSLVVGISMALAPGVELPRELVTDPSRPGESGRVAAASWAAVDAGDLVDLSDRLVFGAPATITYGETESVIEFDEPGGNPEILPRYVAWDCVTNAPMTFDAGGRGLRVGRWSNLASWWQRPAFSGR